jgi:hypothetical protein
MMPNVFGERAIAIDADADGFGAQVALAGTAVAAMATDDMAFGRDPVAHFVAGDALAELRDPPNEFVPDNQAGPDGPLRPFVPVVDVQVGAADGGFFQPDQDLVGAGFGHGDLFHPDAGRGIAFYQGLHRCGHGDSCSGSGWDAANRVHRRRPNYSGCNGRFMLTEPLPVPRPGP